MFRWLGALWDELVLRLKSVVNTAIEGVKSFLLGKGSIIRMAIDVAATAVITWVLPLAGIALAAANFMDGTDTMGALLTGALAFMALELLALWAIEVIVLLGALQFSRFTRRVIHFKEKRELAAQKG